MARDRGPLKNIYIVVLQVHKISITKEMAEEILKSDEREWYSNLKILLT